MNQAYATRIITIQLVSLAIILLMSAQLLADQSLPDKESILTGIEKRYQGKDFSAVFLQQSTLNAIDITEEASGRVYFSHPGKMRWEYLKPEKHHIITDGETLWVYRPDNNQVIIGQAKTFFKSGAGGAFLSDITLIRQQFTITVDNQTEAYTDLTLTPSAKTQDLEHISIRIARATHEISRITTYNSYGDTTQISFNTISFGEIEPGIFSFTPPASIDIIHMDQ